MALINVTEAAADVSVDLAELELEVCAPSDLWTGHTLEKAGKMVRVWLAPHVIVLYRLKVS